MFFESANIRSRQMQNATRTSCETIVGLSTTDCLLNLMLRSLLFYLTAKVETVGFIDDSFQTEAVKI